MKEGDDIVIQWRDGLSTEGVYVKEDKGFIVYRNKEGKETGCRYDSINSINLLTGSARAPVLTIEDKKMKNWIGKFIHNCIAHPLMCFLPKSYGEKFHDWTIQKFWPPYEDNDNA